MVMACCVAAVFGGVGGACASVALTPSFDGAQFKEPESVLWPGYFWLWNAPLDEEVLRAQLRDMAAHGARSVAMLPMPRAFRPDSTNNSMEPDYLTEGFFARAGVAVEEAARLGMNWWLYDEGGWPSGQALGQVVAGHPELAEQRAVRERVDAAQPYLVPEDALVLVVEAPARTVVRPGETWTPAGADDVAYVYRVTQGGRPDLLNPAATDRFIALTHEGYRQAAASHFGSTVRFTFTDEPGVTTLDPPKSITWTPGMAALYAERFGGDVLPLLPELFTPPSADLPAHVAQARIDFFDLWTQRFAEAYFGSIQTWAHGCGLGSGGHLNGEDETINAARYGYGHALRQLRRMDMPGVDLIWRQLFPGRPNQLNFPKIASSAAHQNGTRYAFTESFCVYGNGLTPVQMKWLVDYQYLRGINLLVAGCYPLSTRDHHMTGERPHFGPCNPLWDHLKGFHAYTARLGYALSVGTPAIPVALYYPARDIWAYGMAATEAAGTHDTLANELLARQCDFDLFDDDLLAQASIEPAADGASIRLGAMRYRALACGSVRWMHPDAQAKLQAFADAGGRVACVGYAPGVDGSLGEAEAAWCEVGTVEAVAESVGSACRLHSLDPASRDVRTAARDVTGGRILALFNEGESVYEGTLDLQATQVCRLDAQTGVITRVDASGGTMALRLEPGESVVLLVGDAAPRDAAPAATFAGDGMTLDAGVTAAPRRHFVVGEHDFEIQPMEQAAVPFAQASVWRDWLGEDFSGEADYRADVNVPEAWAGAALELTTGRIEYAATVLLDGAEVGQMLWPPWRIELPPCAAGRHELVIRVANTLANELTSGRVAALWDAKTGPGWPSPYHTRALEFERESRGGGLAGPVVLRRSAP